ncbi:unnamed protein product, partial [Laminaria digitata]
MRDMDRKALTPGEESLPHHLETFDFVAMYNNPCLKRVMNELFELVYTYEETKSGWKSLYVRYAYEKEESAPVIKDVNWSSSPRVDARGANKFTTEFYVGRTKLCEWISFVLDEGFVQFGSYMYKQSSGIFMGTAPAPDLANDFAFMHEFNFLKVMIDEYVHARNTGNEPLYPYAFIEQYGASTKRFIDDILTISLGSQTEGPTFEQIMKQEGNIYGGMYPSFVEVVDGEEIEKPISIIKE